MWLIFKKNKLLYRVIELCLGDSGIVKTVYNAEIHLHLKVFAVYIFLFEKYSEM